MRKKGMLLVGIVCACMMLGACGAKKAADYYKEGLAYLDKQEYEQAEEALAEAVEKNPDRAEYYIDYAFALIQNGKSEEALIQFDKGYSQKDNKIVRENNKKILRGKGIAYITLNRYEEAAECLQQAWEIDEEQELNTDILSYLGLAYQKLGEYEQAAWAYTELINAKKSNASAYIRRAEVYVLQGKAEEAIEDYDTAIALGGGDFSCYFGKYNLYVAAGNEEKAEEVLASAYALKTTTEEDYYNLAIIHYLSGDYDLAAVEMTEALTAGFVEANYYLGCIYRHKNDLDNAFYYYNQYADTVDHIAIAAFYEGMADCYIEQEKYEEALQAVEAGLALRDVNCEASLLYREVYLYEKKAEYGLAAEKAEAYLKLYPEDEEMQEELTFLRSRIQ